MRFMQGVCLAAVSTLAVVNFGCAQKSATTAAAIEDKVYTVTPNAIVVKVGIVLGEVTEMKVMERVEQGTGRVDTAAKLSGKLKLTNGSTDQSVRLLGGKIIYIDDQGQPIKLDATRTEPTLRFSGTSEQLNPRQDASLSIDVDFPAEALKAKKLGEIRLELSYLPMAYKVETAKIPVAISIAAPK